MGTRSKGQDNTFSNAFWELYKSNAMPTKHMGVSASHLRAVLIGLAAHANYSDGRDVKVGQTRIARETGLSISTVKRAMAALLDLGWLVQVKEPTYTKPAHYAIILNGSVHHERSADGTGFTVTPVSMNPPPVHHERGEGSPRTGESVHSELQPINTNQYQSVAASRTHAHEETPLLQQDDPTGLGWEQLEAEVFDQLSELYRGRVAIETAERFIATCRAFKHLCPPLATPQGVLDFLTDQRGYWASAKASEKNYPKSAHDFATWTAKQSAIESYAARVTPNHNPVTAQDEKAIREVRRVDAIKDKIQALVESWMNERERYYTAVRTLWLAEGTPFGGPEHEAYDAMQVLMEETGLTEQELRLDPPWKRSWRDELDKAAAKELGIESWEVML